MEKLIIELDRNYLIETDHLELIDKVGPSNVLDPRFSTHTDKIENVEI